MKKLVLVFFFFFLPFHVSAQEKQKVVLKACVDGDTATVISKKEEIKIRFLAVDTPETKHPKKGTEPFGKEASDFTCTRLKEAKTIQLEYDDHADRLDKYQRHLVWVFVDGKLLQQELVEIGYAKVAYLYGDYKYTSILKEAQKLAKAEKRGIWSIQESAPFSTIEMIILGIMIICFLLYFIFDKKYREKTIKKAKSSMEKEVRKNLKKLVK